MVNTSALPALSLRGVSKRFGGTEILRDIHLDVRRGEMVTLLGPSGCGKSTTLNCVTGIVSPDAGEICIEGVDVTHAPIHARDCGLVFQSFALFPHLSTYENVAFPLRIRKLPKAEIAQRVDEALALVGLADHAKKFPAQLSGGQQQRVGLCRSLVYRPKVLLFDEPLSNLDAKLRETMRFEIREIQRQYGITSIFVTHDQQEALAISDRIAVMDRGRIVQYDTPFEVYSHPATEFVAGFIGLANLLPGTVESCTEGWALIRVRSALCTVKTDRALSVGARVICSVRPKDVQVIPGENANCEDRNNVYSAEVVRKTFLGEVVDYRVAVDGLGDLRIVTEHVLAADVGDTLHVHLPPDRCWPIADDARGAK